MENEVMLEVSRTEFDLRKTLVLGQAFGWHYDEKQDVYYKGLFGSLLAVRQEEDGLYINQPKRIEEVRDYFDLNLSYNRILDGMKTNGYIKAVMEKGRGIHILKQDMFEMIVTFTISSCNNMRRINNSVLRICEAYGKKVEADGYMAYTFPTAADIKEKGTELLKDMGLGYRCAYIEKETEHFCQADANALRDLDDMALYKELTGLSGVGDKVASCIMLFGAHRLDAFPVDRHIKRALEEMTGCKYDRRQYAPYNGLVQQYIFYDRTN
ncbi:MAG: DNA-3-methyladenine glycosylase family protein [Roseburia sp.]